MSVHLTPKNLRDDENAEVINISNGEWCAILAFADAFGIEVKPPASHDMKFYEPGDLREIAMRIEQVKNAPEWLRYLADNGGAISG